MLRHIILSIVFCSTAAAPVNDVVTGELWEDFGSPLTEEILRFLNPWDSPSLKQTIISCLVLLFISAALALPRIGKHDPALEAKLDAIRVLSGMSSPEFMTVKALVNVVEKYNLARAYNRVFHKEDPKKGWSSAHVDFASNGGFILCGGGEPEQVLQIGDLVRMIKAGEIDQPDISKQDIFSRSTCAGGFITGILLCILNRWFIAKFASKIPVLVAVVVLVSFLNAFNILLCSHRIGVINNPFAITRKPQEIKEPILEGDGHKSEDAAYQRVVDLCNNLSKKLNMAAEPVGKVDETAIAAEPAEKNNQKGDTQKTVGALVDCFGFKHTLRQKEGTQATDGARRSLTRRIVLLSVLPVSLVLGFSIIVIAVLLPVFILASMGAVAVVAAPMRDQREVVTRPYHAGTIARYVTGTVVTFTTWITFILVGAYYIPFASDVERSVWMGSSFFLLLQPLIILLFAKPQGTRVYTKLVKLRSVFYILDSYVYSAARLSFLFIGFYSIKQVN